MIIRRATKGDCKAISEMCMRSKAHWGYDDAFMQACKDELALHPHELKTCDVALAELDSKILGYAKVEYDHDMPQLGALFIDPDAIGQGVGKTLFIWAVTQCRERGLEKLAIVSDPFAATFYEKMGSRKVGMVASGSISGRELPAYEYVVLPN
ncbi:MAG: GNAT family N-acetyltransferase [Hyphomicrobiales bacterium]|nr:MAG: GNAT family N-acetyltransferase [Hyphomicrobiales bacterium]